MYENIQRRLIPVSEKSSKFRSEMWNLYAENLWRNIFQRSINRRVVGGCIDLRESTLYWNACGWRVHLWDRGGTGTGTAQRAWCNKRLPLHQKWVIEVR